MTMGWARRLLRLDGGGDDASAEGTPQTLVGISFDDVFRAREFMIAASRLASKKELVLNDVVLVIKDDQGKTMVTETTDLEGGRSAFSGGLWAGLFGMILGGPVLWAAGAVVGAGAGAVAAKVIDLGISDEWVTWFRDEVEPGKAIVAILISEFQLDALLGEARRFTGSQLVYANLDDRFLEKLTEALGDSAE